MVLWTRSYVAGTRSALCRMEGNEIRSLGTFAGSTFQDAKLLPNPTGHHREKEKVEALRNHKWETTWGGLQAPERTEKRITDLSALAEYVRSCWSKTFFDILRKSLKVRIHGKTAMIYSNRLSTEHPRSKSRLPMRRFIPKRIGDTVKIGRIPKWAAYFRTCFLDWSS